MLLGTLLRLNRTIWHALTPDLEKRGLPMLRTIIAQVAAKSNP